MLRDVLMDLFESPLADGRAFELARAALQLRRYSASLYCVIDDRRRSYLSVIGDCLIGPSRIIGFFWLPHSSFPHRLLINLEGVIRALAPLRVEL